MLRLLLLFLFACSINVHGQRIASPKPKLLVFILVDELSTDQLIAFRDKFSDNGFNRIISGGSFYRHASFPAGSVYAGSNLSTLYSGSYAATHGIISNKWYDRLRSVEVNANGVDGDSVYPSAKNMLASTIVDELKWMYNGASKVASIGFNRDFLIWTGGHAPDYVYNVNFSNGHFQLNADTSVIKMADWVQDFNSKNLLEVYCERQWGPKSDLKEYHQLKYYSDELPDGHSFLYSLKKDKSDIPFNTVLRSPYGNKLIRDFAVSHIINEDFGADDVTDVLTIQFTSKSALRQSASAFEAETEDMLLRLDEEIADLIQILDAEVGIENTLIVTSAIGAPLRSLEENKRGDLPGGLFNGKKAASLLNLYLMAIHGQGKWVKSYHDGQIYLNHELLEQSKVPAKMILEQSAKFLMQVEGIAYALPASELMASTSDLAAMQSLKLNYHPKRSGDILIRLQPGWNELLPNNSTVNRHWTDARLPLMFYGWKVRRQNIRKPVSMADVAPSICSFLEIPFPNACEGEPLDGIIP